MKMTLDDFKKELDDQRKWRENHPVLASFESFKDFFQYTIPRKVGEWRSEIRWAWQRVFRGFDNRYWWSHHHEHSRLTHQALTIFRREHVGSPSQFFDFNTSNEDGHKKWEDVLDDMIAGFQAAMDMEEVYITNEAGEYDFEASRKEEERLRKIMDKGLKLYIKYYKNLWD
jgi:hypothetical protein